MTVEHYENFPVASFLLPAHLRPAVEAIYRFARGADDIADEGDASDAERIDGLNGYEAELDRIERQELPESRLFRDLAPVIGQYRLPTGLFRDLLSAFRQDVTVKSYTGFPELLDYCRRSANPVGRLMLHLYGRTSAENLKDADAICTALQLINFWQDVAIDWKKSRIYLPLEDLEQFSVTPAQIATGNVDSNWRALMRFEVDRARAMMLSGAPLALRLPGRIGWELRLVVQGGLRILDRIEAAGYDVFRHRPTIGKRDAPLLLWRAIRMRAPESGADSA